MTGSEGLGLWVDRCMVQGLRGSEFRVKGLNGLSVYPKPQTWLDVESHYVEQT